MALLADTPGALRIRQGLILLVGAIAIVLLIGSSGTAFYWTPVSLGIIYFAGALAGGPKGSYWATAVVLLGWGIAVVSVRQISPDLDTSGLYLAGAGIGATVGVLLARRGFAVDPLGLVATIAAAGVVLALTTKVDALADARTYALAIGAVGLVNLLLGAFASEERTTA